MKKYSKKRGKTSRTIKTKYRTKRNKKRTRRSKRNIKNKKSRIHHKKMIGGGPPIVHPAHRYLLSSEGETGKIKKWVDYRYKTRSFKVDLYHGVIHLIGVGGSGNKISLSDYDVVLSGGMRGSKPFKLKPNKSGGAKEYYFDDTDNEQWMNAIRATKKLSDELKEKMEEAVDHVIDTTVSKTEGEEVKQKVKALLKTEYCELPKNVLELLIENRPEKIKRDLSENEANPLSDYIQQQIDDVRDLHPRFRLVGFSEECDGVYKTLNPTENNRFNHELREAAHRLQAAAKKEEEEAAAEAGEEATRGLDTEVTMETIKPSYGQLINGKYDVQASTTVYCVDLGEGWRIFEPGKTNDFQAAAGESDLLPEKWNNPQGGKVINRPKLE